MSSDEYPTITNPKLISPGIRILLERTAYSL